MKRSYSLILGSWEEQPSSSTTEWTTRPTRPTTEFTTKPQTTRPTSTTTTTSTATATESTIDAASENEEHASHKPPGNRPWWSEYHTQRPEPQQPCRPGTYQPSKDGCQNYYQCKNGRYRKYSCREGSVWNKNANKCDSPRNVNCNEPGEFDVNVLSNFV